MEVVEDYGKIVKSFYSVIQEQATILIYGN